MSLIIGAFYFFYFALIGVHIIFVPKILSMVGYSSIDIGIIFASAPLVRFVVPFLFLKGFKLDHKVFAAALVLMVLGAAGFYPSLTSFWPLLISNIIFGIGISLLLPYIEVIALEHIGKESYGKIRLFGSLGFIAVSLVLVRYLDEPKIGIDFLIAMALATSMLGALIGSLENKKSAAIAEISEQLDSFNPLAHLSLWIGFLLMQVSFGPFYNFFTIYATDHGISLDMTVWLWSFGVLAEIMMFYFQGPLLQFNLPMLLQITALFTAGRWMIVALFPDNLTLLFLAQSFHALSFALFHTAAISLLFSLYRSKRLAQQFFFGISYGLGGFLGALGAGVLYQYAPSWLFIGGAIAASAATIAFRIHIKNGPSHSRNPM
ncbi:MAG: MFS transporter [Sulfuricurvum sp.]|jgi:PPP family 3-phenylpropionic acid transporter